LDQGNNFVRVNSLALAGGYQIAPGTKASIEGFSSTAYVVATNQNIFGTYDVVLGDQPAALLAAASSSVITTALNSTTVTGVDVSKLRVGDVISGTGIPAGAVITSIGSNQITLSSAATASGTPSDLACLGKPIYPTSSSYAAVHMAFGDQTVILNKNPSADSYDAFKVSLGTAYTSATKIGDVRILVKNQVGEDGADVPDGNFKFTDTEGNFLQAGTVDFAAATAGVPKIRAFNVGTGGDINVIMSNGQSFTVGSVLLQSYQDPGALIREGDNLFSGLDTAGPYNGSFRDPNNIDNLRPSMNGLGSINGGALELSNVDLGEEFSTMITTQRAFQAGSRVITTTDQMLEEAVNLKR
jgi:hypothetical protein